MDGWLWLAATEGMVGGGGGYGWWAEGMIFIGMGTGGYQPDHNSPQKLAPISRKNNNEGLPELPSIDRVISSYAPTLKSLGYNGILS